MGKKSRDVGRFKYGVCLNDECPMCKSKQVQQIPMRKELVCAECGKPLRESAPPKSSSPMRWIVIAVAAVVVIIPVVLWLTGVFGSTPFSDESKKGIDTLKVDSVERPEPDVNEEKTGEGEKETDTLEVVPVKEPEENGTETEKGKTPPLPQPKPESYNTGWGTYEGPMEGGQPNGFGGIIIVRSRHFIDLKKADGETIEIGSGDKIMNVKMENGRMRQGEIHFADGTRRFVSGL